MKNANVQQGWEEFAHGNFRKALNSAEAVLTVAQTHRPVVRIQAEVLRAMSRYWLDANLDLALRTLKKLQKQAPQFPIVQYHLATLYAYAGQMEEARNTFREALKLAPNHFGAFHRLAWITKYERIDPLAQRMIETARRGDLSDADGRTLHNGIAKVYSDLSEYELAFKHALAAKKRCEGSYSSQSMTDRLTSLQNLGATGSFRDLPPSGNGSEKPLFIVGLARSGTTLVETILGRHRDVRACGELSELQDIEKALTDEMSQRAGKSLTELQATVMATSEDLRPHAEHMLEHVQGLGKGRYRLFTDKMPTNGFRLGLMARLFPNARIVFLRRDLRDCAISSLFTLLPNAYTYTQRLDWFGHYAKTYYQIIETWRDMLDIRFLEINYEELVGDPEPQVRRLLDFAGLEFQASCLHPEGGDNQIKTSSVFQARQSINSRSVGRWKNYEPWLGPLNEVLEAD